MNKFLIPESFRCLIIGSSGSGKTYLLLKMLLDPSLLDYEKLLLFSRSLHQPYYQLLQKCYDASISKHDMKKLFEYKNLKTEQLDEHIEQIVSDPDFQESSQELHCFEDINELPDPREINSNIKNIVIMDDVIDEKQHQLSKYFTRGRHNNINTFYISQSFFHLPRRTIRTNSNFLIFFRLPLRDVESIYHDIAGSDMSIKEFKQLCAYAWKTQYGFLVIDLTKQKYFGKYRVGLHSVFMPETKPF